MLCLFINYVKYSCLINYLSLLKLFCFQVWNKYFCNYQVSLRYQGFQSPIVNRPRFFSNTSFLGEGNGVKRFFFSSQLSGYFCGFSLSTPPPLQSRNKKKSYVKYFLSEEKKLDTVCPNKHGNSVMILN